VRVDQEEFTGDVGAEIQPFIRSSIAVIADLSESKPNVLYEAGYAHALEVSVIHVCSISLEDLPFDVRNWKPNRLPLGTDVQTAGKAFQPTTSRHIWQRLFVWVDLDWGFEDTGQSECQTLATIGIPRHCGRSKRMELHPCGWKVTMGGAAYLDSTTVHAVPRTFGTL
jgi:hypothetical protein